MTRAQFDAVRSLYEAINDDTGVDPSVYEPLLAKYGIDKMIDLLKEHQFEVHDISVYKEKDHGYGHYTLYHVFIQVKERGEKNYTGRDIELRITLFPTCYNNPFDGRIFLVDWETYYVCQDGTTSEKSCNYKTGDDMYMALENFFTQDAKREPAETEPWTEEQKQAALRYWGDLQLSNDIRNMFND